MPDDPEVRRALMVRLVRVLFRARQHLSHKLAAEYFARNPPPRWEPNRPPWADWSWFVGGVRHYSARYGPPPPGMFGAPPEGPDLPQRKKKPLPEVAQQIAPLHTFWGQNGAAFVIGSVVALVTGTVASLPGVIICCFFIALGLYGMLGPYVGLRLPEPRRETRLPWRIGFIIFLAFVVGGFFLSTKPGAEVIARNPFLSKPEATDAFKKPYEQWKDRLGTPQPSVVVPDSVGEAFHERALILSMQFRSPLNGAQSSQPSIPGIAIIGASGSRWENWPTPTDYDFAVYSEAKRRYKERGLNPPKHAAVPLQGVASLLFYNDALRTRTGYLKVTPTGQLKHCAVGNGSTSEPDRVHVQRFQHGWIVGPVFRRINTTERTIYILLDDGTFEESPSPGASAIGCKTDRSVNDVERVGPLNES